MGWSVEQITYSDGENPNLKTVIEKVQSRLNSLAVGGASSAKVALTDCNAGQPYAILAFNETINLNNMNPTQLSTKWKFWKSSKGNINDVKSDLIQLVNGGTLSDLQLFFSELSLTVYSIPDTPTKFIYTLVLMYRE